MDMGPLIRQNDLLSTLAHELRNPLAPLRTGIELLMSRDDRPEADVLLLKMMERQVAQLVRVTDDVLDHDQQGNGLMRLLPRTFELNEMVQCAIDHVRHLLARKRYDFRLILPERPVMLYGDMERLAQALGHVLDNAVKFTPPGGIIELQALLREDRMVITVRDTGIGIEPWLLKRLLAIAPKVEPLHAQQHGALRTGLRSAERIVQSHGGTMHMESSGPGTGSTFGITLPLTLS